MQSRTRASPAKTSVADEVTTVVGHPLTLAGMIIACVVWTVLGLAIGFPTEWFLVSNIVGTISALLMLLLIQNTKTRQTLAVQAKVD